jgi:hypothetical protein
MLYKVSNDSYYYFDDAATMLCETLIYVVLLQRNKLLTIGCCNDYKTLAQIAVKISYA